MVPGVEGSSPFTHPRYLGREPERRFRLSSHREPLFPPMMGCRQVVRHGTLTPAFAGSSPATPAIFDPLAQLAEHLPFKQGVRGSNPRRVTIKSKRYRCHWRKASGINRFRAFSARKFTDDSIDANRCFPLTGGIRTPSSRRLATPETM